MAVRYLKDGESFHFPKSFGFSGSNAMPKARGGAVCKAEGGAVTPKKAKAPMPPAPAPKPKPLPNNGYARGGSVSKPAPKKMAYGGMMQGSPMPIAPMPMPLAGIPGTQGALGAASPTSMSPVTPMRKGGHLTMKARKALPSSDFALPGKGAGPSGKGAGSYPIDTPNRARNALARGAQNASATEQSVIRRKVHAKYPGVKIAGRKE